jgi:hypothetical protein
MRGTLRRPPVFGAERGGTPVTAERDAFPRRVVDTARNSDAVSAGDELFSPGGLGRAGGPHRAATTTV